MQRYYFTSPYSAYIGYVNVGNSANQPQPVKKEFKVGDNFFGELRLMGQYTGVEIRFSDYDTAPGPLQTNTGFDWSQVVGNVQNTLAGPGPGIPNLAARLLVPSKYLSTTYMPKAKGGIYGGLEPIQKAGIVILIAVVGYKIFKK